MREIIQCLMDWVGSIPSDEKPHQVLRALAEESLKKADLEEKKRRFTNKDTWPLHMQLPMILPINGSIGINRFCPIGILEKKM
ncbi:hypothetical protein [Methylotuvimicrobium sp. KM2]|uniref:hypothetical protein n=1 Tax=Methylotuvimicrobium sp. KM2 TaxID=3133976 RepID=UPI0031017A90